MDPGSLVHRLRAALGGAYTVTGELGRGGFAVVYLAEEGATGRHLAVKVMRPELLKAPDLVERFRREIAFAERLQHPNILTVTFVGTRPDLLYYAMPRLRGQPLSVVLANGTVLPRAQVIRVLRDVGEGLAYAHEQGVIHRDVKPSNIVIEPDGHSVILDFGIAKALSKDGGTLSVSGELIGSPLYMSPEQAADGRDVNEQTDIYSWGVVGYEMLAGTPPFTGTSVQEILYQHYAQQPPSLVARRADLPGALVAVLGRALAKDRHVRWRRMRDAVAALERVSLSG